MLTECLFFGRAGGGVGGEHVAGQGFHFESELHDATISSSSSTLRRDQHNFPALDAFGLIQQSNNPGGSDIPDSLPFLQRLLRVCLARGITQVDLSRNGLSSDKVVELIKVKLLFFLARPYRNFFTPPPLSFFPLPYSS